MPRDGLLRGVEVAPAPEARPLTPQEKRKNWWDYHKFHALAALVAAVAVFGLFYSIFSKVEPDYHIAVVTSYTMPDAGRSELARCFERFAEDRNGDGKVVVDVATYSFATTEATTADQLQRQQSEMARFSVDTGQNESMIFFFDEAEFSYLKGNFDGFFCYNDGTPMPSGAEDFENAKRAWGEFAGLAAFTPQVEDTSVFTGEQLATLFDRLFLCVRSPEGYFQEDEKAMAYYRDTLALVSRMETGETP